jgi:hypothetical protein
MIAAVIGVGVVIWYIAYVVRASKQGRLNFSGRPELMRRAGDDAAQLLGGCVRTIFVILALLAGLFVLIWIIKRMWEAA